MSPSTGPYTFGWYDYSCVDCVSGKMSATGSQYIMILGPNNPIWRISYLGAYPVASKIQGDYWIQLQSSVFSTPVPPIFSCCLCSANQYYLSSTQCGACPANSDSPVGTPYIGRCACRDGFYAVNNNTGAQAAFACMQCPYGTYTDAYGKVDKCTMCPPNSNTTLRGATDLSDCL
jgi:hypothetical protein